MAYQRRRTGSVSCGIWANCGDAPCHLAKQREEVLGKHVCDRACVKVKTFLFGLLIN